MVDPVHLQHVQRLPDIIGRPFLAGMGDDLEAEAAGAGKDAGELFRRVADFARIKANAVDQRQKGQCRIQRGLGVGFGQVAQETHDQLRRDPALLRLGQGAGDAADHVGDRHAARRVALGIKENLDMAHAIGGGAVEIGCRQIEEILLRQQHRHALIVDVEEILEVGEIIGGTDRFHTIKYEADAIALRQRKHHLRLQAAFNVQVQLGLGQAGDEGGTGLARSKSGHFFSPSIGASITSAAGLWARISSVVSPSISCGNTSHSLLSWMK